MAIDPTRFPMPGDPDFDPGAYQRPPDEPIPTQGPYIVGESPPGDPGQYFAPPPPAPWVPPAPVAQPEPPGPQDFSGYIPQPSRSAVFGNAVPRASGNDPTSPRSVAGARPSVPVWARGLMRSPFARFMQRGGQSSLGRIGGFQEDLAPVEDDPLRRQMESLGLPIIQP